MVVDGERRKRELEGAESATSLPTAGAKTFSAPEMNKDYWPHKWEHR